MTIVEMDKKNVCFITLFFAFQIKMEKMSKKSHLCLGRCYNNTQCVQSRSNAKPNENIFQLIAIAIHLNSSHKHM